MKTVYEQKMNGPRLLNESLLSQAGFDPKTGLPSRVCPPIPLLENIKKQLRILDEQNAVNRYTWYNLPNGLTGQMLERMLYYKGQLCLFYLEETDQFLILPYSLCGNVDVYGRKMSITPIIWKGPMVETEKGKDVPFINDFKLTPVYDITRDTLEILKNPERYCVILKDYTPQQSDDIIPRQILMDDLLGAMAEAFPMARTSLIANSGVKGMRVNDESEQSNVKAASRSVTRAALEGDPWIPIVAGINLDDLTSAGSALKSEEYLLYLQALDNYRLSLYGLKNGGLFQKKSHMLESEQQMNDGNVGLVYQDGLTIRQNFCDLVNLMFGLGIWCDVSETVVGVDRNGDMLVGDEKDQSGTPGEQPQMMEEQSDEQ